MRAHLQLLGLFALSIGLSVTFGAERECACDYKKTWLDIVFVFDTSKETNREDFYSIRNFAAALAYRIPVMQHTAPSSRIGVINGGEHAEVVADLTKFTNSKEAFYGILKTEYKNANDFNIASSLMAARDMIDGWNKRNVKKLVIVFSGKSENCRYGHHMNPQMNPCRIASQIKENGGVVMTVALKYDGQDRFPIMKFGSECYGLYFDEQFVTQFLQKLCDANCFCPLPYVQFRNDCHKFGECIYPQGQPVPYDVARDTCDEYNDAMIEVFSEEKDAFLKNLAADKGVQSFWLGATGIDGNYTWTSSGEAVSGYEPWAENQPNVADGNCAFEDIKTGEWSSAHCYDFFNFHSFACQRTACDTNNYCKLESSQLGLN